MRTIDVTALINKTFAFPQGCDDQKRAFLETLDVTETEIAEARSSNVVEILGQFVYSHHEEQPLSGAWYDVARLIGVEEVEGGRYVPFEKWSQQAVRIVNRAKFDAVFNGERYAEMAVFERDTVRLLIVKGTK